MRMPVVAASGFKGHVADGDAFRGEHVQIAVADKIAGIGGVGSAALEHAGNGRFGVVSGVAEGLLHFFGDGFGESGVVFRRKMNLIGALSKGHDGGGVKEECARRFRHGLKNAGQSLAFGERTFKEIGVGTRGQIELGRTDDQHLRSRELRPLLPLSPF